MKKTLITIVVSVLLIGIITFLILFNSDLFFSNNELTQPTDEPACTHRYTPSITAPTCTKNGYTTYICSCGDEYIDNETAAIGHNWGEWIITKESTVNDEGIAERICFICKEKEFKNLARHIHSYMSNEKVIAPTCTEKGYTSYSCACGDSYLGKETAALGHSWGEWVTTNAPTEESDGAAERLCSVCKTKESKVLAMLSHTHKYADTITVPTCTEKGYITHTCVCGDSYIDNEVAAKGHSYTNSVTKETSCTAEGERTYSCACGYSYKEPIAKLPHSYTTVVTAPTCTEKGYTTHTCACGDSYIDNEVAAKGHSYTNSVTKETSCTAEGERTYSCACGYSYKEPIAKLPHSYTTVVTAPTCTEKGYTTHTCACGDSYIDNEVAAKGHSYTNSVTKETSCTAEGERTYSCACGYSYKEPIAKLPHSYTTVVTAPTCTEKGYTTHTCSCGNSYKNQYVDALGHTEAADSAVAATCTRNGKTAGKHCTVCGTVTIAQITIPATGHNYTSVITAPTCTEKGYTTHTCACGDSYRTDEIAALGHHCVTSVFDPSCTESGYTLHACACGYNYRTDEITALGHNYTSTVIAPTCTEKGYTKHTCTCGDSYTDTIVAAKGHQYTSKVTSEATCAKAGLRTYTCACGYSYTTQISKLSHSYTSTVTAPTTTSQGYTTYRCTKCGYSYTGNYTAQLLAAGTCGDNLSWTLDGNGVLTISGSGDMYYYTTSDDAPWYNNCKQIKSISIGYNVTSIGGYAFSCCTALTSIYIPANIIGIGEYAFFRCSNLTSVSFASGSKLEYIWAGGFYGCEKLTQITIPAKCNQISRFVFTECWSLTSIRFEDSSTWYYTKYRQDWLNMKGGTIADLTNPSENADETFRLGDGMYRYWYKL